METWLGQQCASGKFNGSSGPPWHVVLFVGPYGSRVFGYSNSNNKLLINIGLLGQSHFKEDTGLFVNSERDGGQSKNLLDN